MRGVVVGLLLVSTAIAEDVVNTTSESSEEIKEADKVDLNTLNESRRFSSDDTNANTALRSLHISNPINNLNPNQQQPNHAAVSLPDPNVYYSLPTSPQINGQVNNVPPSNIPQKPSVFYPTIPNLNVPTIKDPNLYYSPPSSPQINGQVNNVPPSNILQKPSVFYPTIPNLNVPTIKDLNLYYSPPSSPQINGQVNNVPPSNILQDSSLHYVTPLVTQNHEIGIHPPPPRNILQQNILNQPGSKQEISCRGHSEVLYRVWLILRTLLLDSGSRSPDINQIKHALMLVTNYLNELNAGNLNNEFTMSLEKELEKKRINSQLPTTWNIDIPGLGVSNLRDGISRTEHFSPKCKKSLLKLLELTQAAFAFILNSPDCQENHIDWSSDSYPYQIPYFDQNLYNTGSYSLNQLLGTYAYPSHVLNQKPIGTPDLNALFPPALNPSMVATPNQFQRSPLNGFVNPNVDVQSSPYSPYSYRFHSSVKNSPQFKKPEISLPAQVLPPWYNLQNQQSPSSIPVTRENLLSPQVPYKEGFLNGYTNHFQYNLGDRTFPNNVHQQINLNTPSGSFPMPPNSSPIDQHALWASLQNMSSNPAYRQNIQNYLSSQMVQQHNYQVPPQSGPYVNVNPPVNNNIPPQTHVGNHGFVTNVQPGSLPSQHHGSYNYQVPPQSGPYVNVNPPVNNNIPTQTHVGNQAFVSNVQPGSLPSQHHGSYDQFYSQTHNMHGFNQNPSQGIVSTRTDTSTIDWYNIVNSSNSSPSYTPNGEIELTFAIRRTDQNQPLYFIKYRIPYDVFIQNVRGLLSRRSGNTDIAKGLVIKSNASEVPKELASFQQEELTQIVIKEGVLTKARYIDDSDNDTSSSAANSINALLNKTINKNVDDITAKEDFTRSV